MKVILCLALVAVSYALPSAKYHPLSDEFIDAINSKQSSWTAGRNFHVNTSVEMLRGLVGLKPTPVRTFPVRGHLVSPRETIPDFFDAREQWPDCPSIKEIRDQADCGSCWAFGAVEAMSDRICIHSKGAKKVSVSAEDLLSCCTNCGDGCDGGYLEPSWKYWVKHGITTGGLYGESEGCKAYSLVPCAHHVEDSARPACSGDPGTPACVKQCDDNTRSYESELTFGRADSLYYVPDDAKQIQVEIMTNGPVEAAFMVHEDFLHYKSGVYVNVEGKELGGHAIKILGWGEEEGLPYWLVANSWNSDWGDEGYFKILRGVDHVGIESDVVSALPKLLAVRDNAVL
ncbi:hypothetical protein NQ315_006246 [Exocentrus adspersus]|uniref:Peptidase C1A papain C-terminal domain-containing protein n=1 Tax=Exocentrus adspersus TaxID=1586481 RepID=A0AAV8VZI8_9CUCU|nr:hypothetical protein NQ315_006246 [Exocentrus adspersus]